MRTWVATAGLVTLATAAQAQQQGSVQLSSAAQFVVGDPERRAGQPVVDPDVGVTIYQPGILAGTFYLDLHAVRRADHARVGRTSLGMRDLKFGAMTWSFTGGDGTVAPSLSEYAFRNLFAPHVTFSGGHAAGFGRRGSVTVTAGRVTALRNIFGSDPQTIGQDMGLLQARYRPAAAVEFFARASRVRTRDAREFTYYVDRGDDVGGGVRVRPIPTIEITADAGWSRYVRRGATEEEQSVTALVGTRWTLSRGWVEVNAHRFAPGYFAVLNTPYLDREGAYASGELHPIEPLRVFGGVEVFRTNLDPAASARASAALPRGLTQRAFAGARLRLGGRTFLTVRAEDGDRSARQVLRPGAGFDSDTGVWSAEVHSTARTLGGSLRYERRENVDHANESGTYDQHTGSLHLFARSGDGVHLSGTAMLVQQDRVLGGQTFLQGGTALQVKVGKRPLWLRGEALFTRMDDWQTTTVAPTDLFTVGLSGQLTPRTALAFDVMFDRAPQSVTHASPWLGRSMLRLMHTVPTGAARIGSSPGSKPTLSRRGAHGTITGLAYADWNANGVRDAGEDPLAGVPFVFSVPGGDPPNATQVTSGPTGEFAFVNVPQGRARVGLDLTALPVDYDPPDPSSRETEVRARPGGQVAFGLVPLGSVIGRVLRDSDNDGRDSAGDSPIDGAVVVLDDGDRSEQTHGGAFRFDAVRPGAHAVTLLQESLPEGASIAGEPRTAIVLERANMHAAVTFLVRIEKRPEIRRVFPPKTVAQKGAAAPRAAPDARTVSRVPASARPAARATPAGPATSTPRRRIAPDVWFAIQVTATHDRARARAMVTELQRRGIEAYLSEDADGLAKVRVGSYRSRAAAGHDLARLRDLQVEAWIARIGVR